MVGCAFAGKETMRPTLTIGQLATTTGMTAKTIRYYEEIGLLPAPARAASGYRQYEDSAVERVRFIRRARSLRLPLRRLAALVNSLNGRPGATLRPRLLALVEEQLAAVRAEIAELEVLSQQLEQVSVRIRSSPRPRRISACTCLDAENGHAGGGARNRLEPRR